MFCWKSVNMHASKNIRKVCTRLDLAVSSNSNLTDQVILILSNFVVNYQILTRNHEKREFYGIRHCIYVNKQNIL